MFSVSYVQWSETMTNFSSAFSLFEFVDGSSWWIPIFDKMNVKRKTNAITYSNYREYLSILCREQEREGAMCVRVFVLTVRGEILWLLFNLLSARHQKTPAEPTVVNRKFLCTPSNYFIYCHRLRPERRKNEREQHSEECVFCMQQYHSSSRVSIPMYVCVRKFHVCTVHHPQFGVCAFKRSECERLFASF